MTTAYINRIATSVPPHDVHRAFIDFAESLLPEGTERSLFRRMVRMSAIEHRYSFLEPIATENGDVAAMRKDSTCRALSRHRAAHGGL